jgi:hypothetical protein
MRYFTFTKANFAQNSVHVFRICWLLSFCLAQQNMLARQGATHSEWDRYYPLAVGNTWSYRVLAGEHQKQTTVRWKMTQVENETEGKSFTVWESPSAGDEGMQLVLSPSGLTNAVTGFYLIKFPANAGNEWKYEIDSIRQGRKVVVSYRILSVGSPCRSGTFDFRDCLVVQETDEDINLRTTTYYAMDVGPIKHVYSELNPDGEKKGATQTLELTSYTVQPPPKTGATDKHLRP